jgi:23S rRNA pseudouridine1911/1915/1917 synthase
VKDEARASERLQRRLEDEVIVRYEDEDIAVVSKPAGLLTHSAPGQKRLTLVDVLTPRMSLAQAAGEVRSGIVHRLDKDTSGLLVVAKTEHAYDALVRSMKARDIHRSYRALVSGTFNLPRGRVEAPIGRSGKNPTMMSVISSGRPAVTDFEVLEELAKASHLKVDLVTGRTHQIRVHLAHIRHPVIGDPIYGRSTEGVARTLGLHRPFLHAGAISFRHPLSGADVRVEEPLPPDLEGALSRARVDMGAGR